jgi:hypothetical protein
VCHRNEHRPAQSATRTGGISVWCILCMVGLLASSWATSPCAVQGSYRTASPYHRVYSQHPVPPAGRCECSLSLESIFDSHHHVVSNKRRVAGCSVAVATTPSSAIMVLVRVDDRSCAFMGSQTAWQSTVLVGHSLVKARRRDRSMRTADDGRQRNDIREIQEYAFCRCQGGLQQR